jgi:hypothetical protein
MTVEADTAELLRALLAEVDNGRLDADNPRGRAMVRHMEGAIIALEHVNNAKRARRQSGSRARTPGSRRQSSGEP